MNKTINNKMSKTVERKSLADYPIWVYQSLWSKIISKVKPSSLQLLMNRKMLGKRPFKFCFISLSKSVKWLFWKYWKTKSASRNVSLSKQTCMEVIREHSHENRADSCNGKWLNCALAVLQENNIYPPYSSAAVRKLLQLGHGKSRNILIIDWVNCAKKFLFRSFQLLFDTLCTPWNNMYAWIAMDGKEVIFLNGFRWSSDLILWETCLGLLEIEVVDFPLQNNHFSKYLTIFSDVPIFVNSKSRIKYPYDPIDSKMMDTRWEVFELS